MQHTAAAASPSTPVAPTPCRTLYIRNLPPKLKVSKLRSLLYTLCSTHGKIVSLRVSRAVKLRSQAFLTYYDQSDATSALQKLHGTEFETRNLCVTYARSLTDIAQSPKLGGESRLSRSRRKKNRAEERERLRILQDEEEERKRMELVPVAMEVPAMVDEPPPVIAAPVEPNRILFLENLPKALTKEEEADPVGIKNALTDLFARFRGFVEVRTVPGKVGIAFVEFGQDSEAAVAMDALQGNALGDPPLNMSVSFAKK